MARRVDPLEAIAGSPWARAVGRSPVGRMLAKATGVPTAVELRRGRELPRGGIALMEVAGQGLGRDTLSLLGFYPVLPVVDTPDARTPGENGRQLAPVYESRLGALVLDLTGLSALTELERVRAVLRPAMRGLEPGGRVILVARDPESLTDLESRVLAQGLDGLNRTVAKELRAGATSNLVQVAAGTTPEALASTLRFLLEGRSAYVDGQTWRVGTAEIDAEAAMATSPYAGQIVAVTGAARGIGAAIAATLARDGATVICIDVPAAGESLAKVANQIRGTALQLDITTADAGARIAAQVTGRYGPGAGLYGIVHNAGITRDRTLANLDEVAWAAVVEVNLAAQLRINEALLDGRPGGLADGGSIVGISSTSGIAGAKGQANYALTKAGIVGLVRAEAPVLAERGITINAVAPGFIETDMTAAIPYLQRQLFSRANSLSQGGKPIDVAETIAYLADPASAAVTGQVVRVCGQALVGQ